MEIVDVYADGFETVANPYGMVLNFSMSPPRLQPSYPEQPMPVARVRMSWEMAKVLTFILLRMIKKAEVERGLSYPIGVEVLNNLKIAKEDWDLVWTSAKPNLGTEQ